MSDHRGRATGDSARRDREWGEHRHIPLKDQIKLLDEYQQASEPLRTALRCRLLGQHLRLAGTVAAEFKECGEWGDLLGLATEGLAAALDAWDPKRCLVFDSFAKLVIRRHVSRESKGESAKFRAPKGIYYDLALVAHAADQFQVANGRRPTRAELQDLCPLRRPTAYDLDGQWPVTVELDERTEESVSDGAADPAQSAVDQEDLKAARNAVENLFSQLTAEERLVLTKSLGLDEGDGLSLKEVGQLMHPPRRRQYVAEIRKGAIEKLRAHPAAKELLRAMEE